MWGVAVLGVAAWFGVLSVAKHRGVKYRKASWQFRTELMHRWDGFKRDVAYDWRNFWLDVAEWRENRHER